MVYVVIEQDDGPNYFKFATLMTAAYYLSKNEKLSYTISDEPLIEVDDSGYEYLIDEDAYRMI